MKTTIVTLTLLTTALAFAAPAQAECTGVDATGTFACAFVEDANNHNIFVGQDGAGGASVDAFEAGFFGQSFRGRSAFAYTDSTGPAGWNNVMVSEFCFASGSGCSYQEHSLFIASQHAGFAFVGLSQSAEERLLCFSVGDQFGCQTF